MNVKPWLNIKVVAITRALWAQISDEDSPFNLESDIKKILSDEDDIETIEEAIKDDLEKGLYEACLYGTIDSVCCLKMRVPIGGHGKRNGARAFIVVVRFRDTAYLLALRSHVRGNTKNHQKNAELSQKEEKIHQVVYERVRKKEQT